MKNLSLFTLALLLSLSPMAMASSQEIDIGVNGMVCSFCAQGIEKKFHAQPSVDDVKVSLSKKNVKLTLKDGQKLDDPTIKRILTDAGYSVQSIVRK